MTSFDESGNALTQRKEPVLLSFLVLALILGAGLSFSPQMATAIVLFLVFFTVFLLKKELAVYLIILALFFEGHSFSHNVFGARVRASQVIELVALAAMAVFILFRKLKLEKTPLDVFIWMYLGANFLALSNSTSLNRSIKISILLLSLALLYYVVVNFVRSRETFFKAFNLLVYVGIAEIVYGLYQVFAGMSNAYLGTGLPIGHAGIMQRGYLNAPWGRPYGTFVEPDWYGAIVGFYAVLFLVLCSTGYMKNRKLYVAGLGLSLIALFFSFVRASWVGFVCAVAILIYIRYRKRLKRVTYGTLYKVAFLSILIVTMVLILSPRTTSILWGRLTIKKGPSEGSMVARTLTAKYAMMAFLKNPIIGNGPGNPIIEKDSAEYRELSVRRLNQFVNREYPYSILMTLLNDTGVIGLILFLSMIARYVKYNMRYIPKLAPEFQIIVFSLFMGILALFISYLITNGFWIPFTWFFLALNIAGVRIALEQ
jgi:hypothetical protein